MAGKIITPNNVTIARLFLSAGFFILLSYVRINPPSVLMIDLSVAVFLLAGLSDVIDGYLARKMGMITTIGRILDPFVDKVMICGSFIFFLGSNFVQDAVNITGVVPWMVILIIGRELLVTSLRGQSESQGKAFPATAAGKIKMFLQSATVVTVLITIAHFHHQSWAQIFRVVLLWTMVISTILSMFVYVSRFVTITGLVDPKENSQP
jgi:CDP-diacylglycerol--glycerol-3-phosphate 3-phosphatidyltransferase